MTQRLCKDCAHFRRFWLRPDLSKCAAWIEPIDGKPGAFCDVERKGAGFKTGCGRDAELWTPRPKRWWQFWK